MAEMGGVCARVRGGSEPGVPTPLPQRECSQRECSQSGYPGSLNYVVLFWGAASLVASSCEA